jgi:pimeloyl-ACP methyl ester carboxylesterase
LRSQLEHPDAIDLYGEKTLNLVDLQPERLKTETPVFWLGGWGATAEVHEDNIINLAERGRRTLAVDAPHGIESANIQESATERGQEIHDIELRKVAAVLKSLDEKGIAQTDIVAHSEGAIYGVLAALLRPEKFRNIVLVDPAGMVGEDTKGRLVTGAILDIGLQIARIYKKILTKEGFEAFKQSNTATKALAEVFASDPRRTVESVGVIAETQVHEILKTLKGLGMKISIVHGVDDRFFPMERIQQQTTTEMVDGFYSVQGTHNQL